MYSVLAYHGRANRSLLKNNLARLDRARLESSRMKRGRERERGGGQRERERESER
jgi:hypothetical protein